MGYRIAAAVNHMSTVTVDIPIVKYTEHGKTVDFPALTIHINYMEFSRRSM